MRPGWSAWRAGRDPVGQSWAGKLLGARITALLDRPGPWTVPWLWQYLRPMRMSRCTLYRRVRQVAIWRRPKLIAWGDPAHDAVVAAIARRLRLLPPGAVVWAADETHLHLLPHLRASWTLPGRWPQILTPGKNRQLTLLGALEMTTGTFVYRLGRRCAGDFLALLQQLAAAFPRAPAIVVLCDNDQIHHARTVRAFVATHPGLIHEGEGVAAKTLESLGISLAAVRKQVEAIIGRGQQAPSGHIPFHRAGGPDLPEASARTSASAAIPRLGQPCCLWMSLAAGRPVRASVSARRTASGNLCRPRHVPH
jgi:hypothetical protein